MFFQIYMFFTTQFLTEFCLIFLTKYGKFYILNEWIYLCSNLCLGFTPGTMFPGVSGVCRDLPIFSAVVPGFSGFAGIWIISGGCSHYPLVDP